jgi:hypothetical protein
MDVSLDPSYNPLYYKAPFECVTAYEARRKLDGAYIRTLIDAHIKIWQNATEKVGWLNF